MFASYGDKFEAVSVNDIATDDISEYLKGVDAVIHAAAPLPSKGDQKALVNGALGGSLNIIRQAEKEGIRRIIYTSSIVAVFNPSGSLTDKDWNPMTEEETLTAAPFAAYMGAKTLAERAVWKFADEHKHVDITVVNPPYIFGPFAPGFRVPKPDYGALSTNLHIYHFLTKKGRAFPSSPGSSDVRDVARIHVEALTSAPESTIGRKRLPIASPYDGNYKQAVQFIAEAHPELKDRLVDVNTAPQFPVDKLPVDLKRVQDVTGVKVDSYHTWKETVLDTIDSLLALEKGWVSGGYKVEIPALEEYGF
jgi:nucleoside-diphosphate-sugar epimerase